MSAIARESPKPKQEHESNTCSTPWELSRPPLVPAFAPIANGALAGGAVGMVGGGILGALRGHPVPFYACSVGFNFFFASGVFHIAKEGFRQLRGHEDAYNAAAAGMTSGAVVARVWAGPVVLKEAVKATARGAFAFTAAGVGAHYAMEYFMQWKEDARRGMLRELELEREAARVDFAGVGDGAERKGRYTAARSPMGEDDLKRRHNARIGKIVQEANKAAWEEAQEKAEELEASGGSWFSLPVWSPIKRVDKDKYEKDLVAKLEQLETELTSELDEVKKGREATISTNTTRSTSV